MGFVVHLKAIGDDLPATELANIRLVDVPPSVGAFLRGKGNKGTTCQKIIRSGAKNRHSQSARGRRDYFADYLNTSRISSAPGLSVLLEALHRRRSQNAALSVLRIFPAVLPIGDT
jgi:hypothetical protein